MSIHTEVNLYCDGDDYFPDKIDTNECHSRYDDFNTEVTDARRKAKDDGWIRRRVVVKGGRKKTIDLCPACAERV